MKSIFVIILPLLLFSCNNQQDLEYISDLESNISELESKISDLEWTVSEMESELGRKADEHHNHDMKYANQYHDHHESEIYGY